MQLCIRIPGVVVLATLISGCGLLWMFEEPESRDSGSAPVSAPSETGQAVPSPVATPTPTPDETAEDESAEDAFSGELAKGASCTKLGSKELAVLEQAGAVGGAITYSRGAMVESTSGWWVVAVATQVNPNSSGHTAENVPAQVYFATNSASLGLKDAGESTVIQELSDGSSKAAAKAKECVKGIPTPTPKPSPGDPSTYTGKLAKGATCKSVSDGLLAHLEGVGQVGGAVTYSRGQMVRANDKWWTIAVATQVNPNSAGLTADNVPEQAFFVTNAPSYKASSTARIVYFPLNPSSKDKAATQAARCLEQAG